MTTGTWAVTASTGECLQLADALRRLRESRGLAGRRWAQLLGVSQPTVSRLENGGDPGWSTVRLLARRLPELPAAALLGPRARGPLPASGRSWTAWRELVGFWSRRVVVEVGPDGGSTIEVEGLRLVRGTLRDRGRRIVALGAVLVGSPELAYELETTERLPLGRPRRFESETAVHEIDVPARPDERGVTYRCRSRGRNADTFPFGPAEGPFDAGPACWLDHPTEKLVLRAPGSLGVVVPWAWPPSITPTPAAARRLWRRLYPHAPRALEAAGGRHVLEVDRPPQGLAHGLAPGDEAGEAARGPVVVGPLRRTAPGRALRRARRAEGISQRELADRVGCSPATVGRLEAGAEPRLSLVRACLEALPAASPFELLPLPAGRPTPLELWHEQRSLFGTASAEERRVVTIDAEGGVDMVARSLGISWDPVHGDELGLRFGTARTPAVAPAWDLEAVESRPGSREARVRVVKRSLGGALHDVRLRAPAPGRRLDLVRRISLAGAPPSSLLRHEAGRRRANNVFLAPTLPVERVTVELRFPAGAAPRTARVACQARACPPTSDTEDVWRRVFREPPRADVDPARGRIRLRIERPLVGLRMLLTWDP